MSRIAHAAMSSARKSRVGAIALLLSLTGAASVGVVYAEDEDTSASVYLVFDAETGEFVTQDDPHAALPNQTGLEDSGLPESDEDADNSAVPAEVGLSARAVVFIGAVIVIGGAAFFMLRRQKS